MNNFKLRAPGISLSIHNSDCYAGIVFAESASALDSFAKEARIYALAISHKFSSILSTISILSRETIFATHIPDRRGREAQCALFFISAWQTRAIRGVFPLFWPGQHGKKVFTRQNRLFRIIIALARNSPVCFVRACTALFSYSASFRELQVRAFAPFTANAIKNRPCYVSLRSFAEVSARHTQADRFLITTRWVYGVQVTGWGARSNSSISFRCSGCLRRSGI